MDEIEGQLRKVLGLEHQHALTRLETAERALTLKTAEAQGGILHAKLRVAQKGAGRGG